MTARKAACGSAGALGDDGAVSGDVLVYYIGSVQFQRGPCNASTLTFQLQASDQASCIALHLDLHFHLHLSVVASQVKHQLAARTCLHAVN